MSIAKTAIRRPGLMDMLSMTDYLATFMVLSDLGPEKFNINFVTKNELSTFFNKVIPRLSKYCGLMYYLFNPIWKPEVGNSSSKRGYYQALYETFTPTGTTESDDDADPEAQMSNAERNDYKRHQRNKAHLKLKDFLRKVQNQFLSWGLDEDTQGSRKSVREVG